MPVFVDTNVLVYVRDATEPEKQATAAEWVGQLWETRLGRLSYQVLHEYYVTLTQKLDPARTKEDARDDLTALHAWNPIAPDRLILERAWSIQDRFGASWWDALIVSAAVGTGSRYLLTEDLQSGQEIDSLTVISPFEHTPEEILAHPTPRHR